MRSRLAAPVVTLVCLVLAGAGLVTSPASAAGSYRVALTASRTVGDVGQAVVLRGTVTGRGAVSKTLLAQRRVGDGAWRTVARPRTTAKGAYRVRTTLPSAGTVSYRVVAPRGGLARGTSPTRSVQAWRWLDLYGEPYLSIGGYIERGPTPNLRIGGVAPPRSTLGLFGDGTLVAWNLDRSCDRVVAQLGVSDSQTGETRTMRLRTQDDEVVVGATGGEGLEGYADLTTEDVGYFSVTRQEGGGMHLVSPRAHCRVDRLPVASD